MLAAVCSRLEACSSVRCERSVVPAETWLEAGHHRLGRGAHLRHHAHERLLHLAQHPQQVAGLVLGVRADVGREVTLGQALGEAHGARDRREHGAADEEIERHERRQHRRHGSGDGHVVGPVRALDRDRRGLRTQVPGGALGLLHDREDLAVHAASRGVGPVRVEAGALVGLESLAIDLGGRLVRRERLLDLGAHLVVRRAGARFLHALDGLLLRLLEGVPALLQLGRVAPAQQHVLPLLHLLLEVRHRQDDGLLRAEVVTADPVEVADGAVHLGERAHGDRGCGPHGGGDDDQDLDLQAVEVHFHGCVRFFRKG
jgi:hypothetical protein